MATGTTIAQVIENIESARNTIYSKLSGTDKDKQFGLTGIDNKIESIATATNNVPVFNKGTVDVNENATINFSAGYYHPFSVKGASAQGNYTVQEKTIDLTDEILADGFTVDNDEGTYALNWVKINPATSYLNFKQTTATADNVLTGTKFVAADNTVTDGKMPNNGAISKVLDVRTGNTEYTVPLGYTSGGKVSIVTQIKDIEPLYGKSVYVTPDAGKVLSQVEVLPIPSKYQDVSSVDAVASNVLEGKKFVAADGEVITGTMDNIGNVATTLTTTSPSKTLGTGYVTGGTISVASETKNVTPSVTSQTVTGSNGKFLTSVTVAAIPNQKTAVTDSIDGLIDVEVTIPAGYYTEASVVTFDDSAILSALQAI